MGQDTVLQVEGSHHEATTFIIIHVSPIIC